MTTDDTKAKRDEQNEIVRPKDDTDSGKIWAAATAISEEMGRPARRDEVFKEPSLRALNEATMATQYARWVKFHGVGDAIKKGREQEVEARKAEAQKAVDAAKAEKANKIAEEKKTAAEKKAETDKKKAEKKKADDAKKAADAKAQADKDKAAKQANGTKKGGGAAKKAA